MHKGNVKLPDALVLKKHIADGMDAHDIADRYSCTYDSAREALKRHGLLSLIASRGPNKPTIGRRATLERFGVRVMDDKIEFSREMTAGEYGGMVIRRMSLPRVSMYVAALQDAGRC
jgi:hypothetical protein